MKKLQVILIAIIISFMFSINAQALVDATLSEVVSNANLYKNTGYIHISQSDIEYLDDVNFANFSSLKIIYLENVYTMSSSDYDILNSITKISLYIKNSILDLSKFNYANYKKVFVDGYVYDLGSTDVSSYLTTTSSVDYEMIKYLPSPTYLIDEEYDAYYNTLANMIKSNSTDELDIIKNVTLYVMNAITYDNYNTYGSLSMSAAIINYGYGQCRHYAFLEAILLNKLGIYTLYISGYVPMANGSTVYHAWNYVYLNGTWYGIDPTWLDEGSNMTDITASNAYYAYYMADLSNPSSVFRNRTEDFSDYDLIPASSRVSTITSIDTSVSSIIKQSEKEITTTTTTSVAPAASADLENPPTGVSIKTFGIFVGILSVLGIICLKKQRTKLYRI